MNRFAIACAVVTVFSATAYADVDCRENSEVSGFLVESYRNCSTKVLDAAAFKAIAEQSDHDHLCVAFESETPSTVAQLTGLATITDIGVVAKLAKLEWLRLDKTKVKELKPVLANAKHLQSLSLPDGADAKAIYAVRPSLKE